MDTVGAGGVCGGAARAGAFARALCRGRARGGREDGRRRLWCGRGAWHSPGVNSPLPAARQPLPPPSPSRTLILFLLDLYAYIRTRHSRDTQNFVGHIDSNPQFATFLSNDHPAREQGGGH